MTNRYAIVVGLCLTLAVLGTAYAQSPGGSHAFGKSLTEWMTLDNSWRLGGEQSNPEGKMVFLPDISSEAADGGEWVYDEDSNTWTYAAEIDVALEPGQKFAMPLIYFYGEVYEDGTEDDPDDYDVEALLAAYDIQVSLDGDLILDTTDEDIGDSFYGPAYFDETIEFDEPNPYSGGIGATWVAGYGFVHQPLSTGEHTLVWYLYATGEDIGEDYDLVNMLTLNIEVDR